MSTAVTVGIIGVGHLIRHMVPAMVRSSHRFILSARGRKTSSRLADQYDLEIAESNQDIVNRADIVILSVRPFDAVAVVTDLEWRDGQTVLSFCAGTGSAELALHIAPAKLVMAMPVVAAQFKESPTLLYPDNMACRTLLETCGPVIALASEEQFSPASVIACYYGWVHELVGQVSAWLSEHGIEPDVARQLVAQMTRAAATSVRERIDTSVEELLAELATPRSFTAAGLEILHREDSFAPWRHAADHLVDQQKS